jgi:hypothetical protein
MGNRNGKSCVTPITESMSLYSLYSEIGGTRAPCLAFINIRASLSPYWRRPASTNRAKFSSWSGKNICSAAETNSLKETWIAGKSSSGGSSCMWAQYCKVRCASARIGGMSVRGSSLPPLSNGSGPSHTHYITSMTLAKPQNSKFRLLTTFLTPPSLLRQVNIKKQEAHKNTIYQSKSKKQGSNKQLAYNVFIVLQNASKTLYKKPLAIFRSHVVQLPAGGTCWDANMSRLVTGAIWWRRLRNCWSECVETAAMSSSHRAWKLQDLHMSANTS